VGPTPTLSHQIRAVPTGFVRGFQRFDHGNAAEILVGPWVLIVIDLLPTVRNRLRAVAVVRIEHADEDGVTIMPNRRQFLVGAAGLLAAAALDSGCARHTAGTPSNPDVPDVAPPSLQPVSQTQLQTAAQADAAFGAALYQKLAADNEQFVFSPYSVATALRMTWVGAKGQTASEMAAILGITVALEQALAADATLRSQLAKYAAAKGGTELETANVLWPQSGFPLKSDFVGRVEAAYGAHLKTLDFKGDAERARSVINQAIAQQTNDKIENLLPSGAVTDQTRLVLTNAVYLNAKWLRPFDPDDTNDGEFTRADGSTVTAPMMSQLEEFGYVDADSHQGLVMKYLDSDLSMIVLLPKADLAPLEAAVRSTGITPLMTDAQSTRVQVFLPRWKTSTGADLVKDLNAMGMREAFGDRADFSGITDADSLQISGVYHQARISVGEKGTEAEAATAVVEKAGAAPGPQGDQPPVFEADRPFLYAIIDGTGTPLFVGRVTDPSKEQ